MKFILTEKIEEANCITHGGTFHADDIFSTVFLSKIMGSIILYRADDLFEPTKENQCVFDIGYGEFDHHMNNAKVRENGLKYASFGLLWEKYGMDYLETKKVKEKELANELILKEFILQIDAFDNGVFLKNPKDYSVTPLANVIELFNPSWKETGKKEEYFKESLNIAEKIFDRIITRILDKLEAKDLIEASISESKNHILILEKYLPFMEFILKSKNKKAKKIIFVIFPSNRGGYNIRTVNKELGSSENRLNFPVSWGGKSREELVAFTKVETIRFCHKNLFLCSCDTLKDAIEIAQIAIKNKNKPS